MLNARARWLNISVQKRSPSNGKAAPEGAASRRRVNDPDSRSRGLRGLDVVDGNLSRATVFPGVEGDLLALDEAADAGLLKSRGVDENVLSAAVRLDETKALLAIVEFHGA